MGACASRFTVLKTASDAPPPAVENEVECRELNPAEEVAVKKEDASAVEDEVSRRQSLGHLLNEGEEKKSSAESNGTEEKPEAVAVGETERAPIVDGLNSKALEEDILACENVATEMETVEPLKREKSEEKKAVEVPESLEAQPEKEEEKPAEATKCETPETEKTDAEKKGTHDKMTESTEIETLEHKPEATEEQKPTSEAEKKNAEEQPIETSEKKHESPEIEKKEQKEAPDVEKNEVEDKHVLEPRTTENCSADKASEPASDAEKFKAEEEKAKS